MIITFICLSCLVLAWLDFLLIKRTESLERQVEMLFDLEKQQDAINKMLLKKMKELEKDGR